MSLRARILAGFVILALAGFYFLFEPILDRVERQYLEAAEEPMVDAAELLAGIVSKELESTGKLPAALGPGIEAAAGRELNARIYGMRKQRVLMGVYIANERGVIIFDSDHPGRVSQDFSKFNDVSRTLVGDYGARSTRAKEADDSSSVMYVGAPIIVNGRIAGALSVYKPQTAMWEFISQTRREIRTLGMAAIAVFLGVGVLLAGWVTEPLSRLTKYAEAVTRGARVDSPRLPGRQLRVLGDSVERMRDALEDRNYVASYVQTLSHEMKAPVAAIRGAAELLDEEMPAADRARFIANIRSESTRLQNLIEQLLALSSLESRKNLENPQVVDLAGIAGRIVDEMKERGAVIKLDIDGDCHVSGDEFLLETAIRNLIQNARDFSPPSATVEVKVTAEKENATVTVADRGAGLPAYAVGRVFDRFYSLPRPGTERKSSGLGLCFVRETASLHGGTATLANREPGPGAIATLAVSRTGA